MVFEDGTIGVVAGRVTASEAGVSPGRAARCVRGSGGTWTCGRLEVRSSNSAGPRPQWLANRGGREYYVFDDGWGASIWTSMDGTVWSEVAPRAEGETREPPGSAWITSDDALHVLVGNEEWVVREEALERSTRWPIECLSLDVCVYEPLDDLNGHLVRYFIAPGNRAALELSEIGCDGSTCAPLSRAPLGPASGVDGRLVHRADGAPTFFHQPSLSSSTVHATTTESSLALTPADVDDYDAVSLPDGRIAVGVATYSGVLRLLFVDATGVSSGVDLDRDTASTGVSVALTVTDGAARVLVLNVERDDARLFEITTGGEVVGEERVPLPR